MNTIICRALGRKALRIALALLGFIMVGYLSNAASIRKCERITLQALIKDHIQKDPKYVRWVANSEMIDTLAGIDLGDHSLEGRLKELWFMPKSYMPRIQPSPPWAYLMSEGLDLPYVVKCYYGYQRGFLDGEGGVKYFVCLAGLAFEVKDWRLWIS